MKKIVVTLFAFVLCTSVFAAHKHGLKPTAKKPSGMIPGCEIKITNRTDNPVYIYATYQDGAIVPAFQIPAYDSPHYIDLYHPDNFGYYNCNSGMNINVYGWDNRLIYSGFWFTNQPMEIKYTLGTKNATISKV